MLLSHFEHCIIIYYDKFTTASLCNSDPTKSVRQYVIFDLLVGYGIWSLIGHFSDLYRRWWWFACDKWAIANFPLHSYVGLSQKIKKDFYIKYYTCLNKNLYVLFYTTGNFCRHLFLYTQVEWFYYTYVDENVSIVAPTNCCLVEGGQIFVNKQNSGGLGWVVGIITDRIRLYNMLYGVHKSCNNCSDIRFTRLSYILHTLCTRRAVISHKNRCALLVIFIE